MRRVCTGGPTTGNPELPMPGRDRAVRDFSRKLCEIGVCMGPCMDLSASDQELTCEIKWLWATPSDTSSDGERSERRQNGDGQQQPAERARDHAAVLMV